MKFTKSLLTLGFLLLALMCMAQLTPKYSTYTFNPYRFNNAYGGFDRSLSITLQGRNQWTNLPGEPQTYLLNMHLPVYRLQGALGLMIEQDNFGDFSRFTVGGSYNYRAKTGFGFLSGGLRASYNVLDVNSDGIRTPDGNYEGGLIDHRDPILPNNGLSGNYITWEAAVYAIVHRFEGGISLNSNIPNNIGLDQAEILSEFSLNAMATYYYQLNEDIWLRPSLLVLYHKHNVQTYINLMANYQGQFFGGLGLTGYSSTSLESLQFIIGFKWNQKFKLAYSYDLGLGGLAKYHNGTHELVVNYNLQKVLGVKAPPKVIYNPRYLW